jgi:hypothetical protein
MHHCHEKASTQQQHVFVVVLLMAKDLWMNDPILFLMKSVGVDFSVSRKD